MSLTDYKYRKAREMVRKAGVGKNTQEMFFCALRQYKKGVNPETGTFQSYGNRACLVGAALADRLGFGFRPEEGWEDRAVREFKVSEGVPEKIVEGFDCEDWDIYQDIKKSRVSKLAHNIAVFLGAKDPVVKTEEEDDDYYY